MALARGTVLSEGTRKAWAAEGAVKVLLRETSPDPHGKCSGLGHGNSPNPTTHGCPRLLGREGVVWPGRGHPGQELCGDGALWGWGSVGMELCGDGALQGWSSLSREDGKGPQRLLPASLTTMPGLALLFFFLQLWRSRRGRNKPLHKSSVLFSRL